jgi:hypothetical protein
VRGGDDEREGVHLELRPVMLFEVGRHLRALRVVAEVR